MPKARLGKRERAMKRALVGAPTVRLADGSKARLQSKRELVEHNLSTPKGPRHSGSLGSKLAQADGRLHAGRVCYNAPVDGGAKLGRIERGKFKPAQPHAKKRFGVD